MSLQILRWPVRFVLAVLSVTGLLAITFGTMIATPLRQPPELASITVGVRKVDWSDLPALQRFQARDGTELAYRTYEPVGTPGVRIALLVHGSAGSSVNMHAVGKALAAAGIRAVAVDMRGHGRSGARGDIAYLGQLDDDLADTVAHVRTMWPTLPITLVGHSAGGGFVLRIAGGPSGDLFERFVLLAPFLDPFAATSKPNAGSSAWAQPNVPRILAINLLQRFGITAFEHLPVVAFALPAGSALRATGAYSYALLTNFGTGLDHKLYLNRVRRPVTVIAGSADELMRSERYDEVMRRPGLDLKAIVVPEVDHMGVLSATAALEAITNAVKRPSGT